MMIDIRAMLIVVLWLRMQGRSPHRRRLNVAVVVCATFFLYPSIVLGLIADLFIYCAGKVSAICVNCTGIECYK